MAEKYYRETLEIDPQNALAANNLAFILAEGDGNLKEALDLASKAKEIAPDDPNIMDTLGWVYLKNEYYDFALMELKEAAAKLDDIPQVQYHLGMAWYKKGEKEKARDAFEKALGLGGTFKGAEKARSVLEELVEVERGL